MESDAGKRRSKGSRAEDGSGRDDRHRHSSSRNRHHRDRYVDDERKSRHGDHERPEKRDKERDRKRAMARRIPASLGRPEHGGDLVVRPPLAVTAQSDEPCSECLVLKNVFDGAVEENPKFYLLIRDTIHERCAQFGPVHHIHVDKNFGFVYLRFDSEQTSTDAQKGFDQSLFERREITATFMSIRVYSRKFQAAGQSCLANIAGVDDELL